ncbi:MAG: N-acetyl-gamma-glutamyl-phosphate reductase [Magnetovibrionaceae bacterium]
MGAPIKAVIIGASGYTGAELVRLLCRHESVRLVALTADRKAGMAMGDVFPHLASLDLPDLISLEAVDWAGVDVAFCCLPHGTTQEVISGLPESVKVVDLSADFRLRSTATYAEWYGHEHLAPELQKTAVYGLTELYRQEVAAARLVANPGCYPSSVILPVAPLLKSGLVEPKGIIADCKSGVSGAGRAPKEGTLFTEVSEAIHAYGIASHRHGVEIEQELSKAHGEDLSITFTPHLVPMNRGILSTIYLRLKDGVEASALRDCLRQVYASDPFIRILDEGKAPGTRHVRGSNQVHIGVFQDRVPGQAIIISAIDNLVKGAAGQAVQNMNLMFALDETAGLEQAPMFP